VQTGVNDEGCSVLPGVQFVIDEKFCLLDMVKLELHKFEDEVGEIVNRAQKEEKMETALKKISETWEVLQFELQQHRDTDLQLIRLVEEDNETLEDHQV
jgi:dynein heavy chain